MTWYALNVVYNMKNLNVIETTEYKLHLPKHLWRINHRTNYTYVLDGISSGREFLSASIEENTSDYTLLNLQASCNGKSMVNTQQLNLYDIYDITCDNEHSMGLQPYRIYWVPNQVFVFMYDYNKTNKRVYDSLIENIFLKKTSSYATVKNI